MVVHQTINMNNRLISFCGGFQIFEELHPIPVTLKYRLSFIPSGGYMIKRPGKGYSEWSGQNLEFIMMLSVYSIEI